jgi:hypothetical protein
VKLFFKRTDGGPETNVIGYWLIEWKSVFSIALLRFSKGSRENFHSHAFNAVSWILRGRISVRRMSHVPPLVLPPVDYTPSLRPIVTSRGNLHKVYGVADATWALTIRGPWRKTWKEYNAKTGKTITLSHGREVV